jgi:fibro-slime domain-containing protein
MNGRIVKGLLGAGIFLFSLVAGCGVRSQLRGAQPCAEEGKVESCLGICGEGTTTCSAGFWSACDIPARQESCEGVCGIGIQTCENEAWSECYVAPTEASCENECGIGIQTCIDEEWSECSVDPVTEECTFGCGPGTRTCANNSWGECSAPRPLPPVLRATVRDFHSSHPDFERPGSGGLDPGIVLDLLGPDGKPVYAGGPGGTLTTTGAEELDQWYRDVPGVNERTEIDITLQTSSASDEFYVYVNRAFFPIDGQLFGNEGYSHNYHFTLEAEASFIYREGQVFAFDGDDDIFVFINNRLVIDLGGLHESLRRDVDLDSVASDIGIEPGNEYPLKIFFAERHITESNFVIETSIADLGECP